MASPKPVSLGSGKEESPPAPSPPRQNEDSDNATTPTRVQEADDSSESQAHDAREQGEISDSDAPPLPNEPLPATAAPAPPVITGYNPAIHGDYDPNAWYAKGYEDPEAAAPVPNPDAIYESTALFNRFTGQYQTADQGPARHSDEAKAKRQMNAYFDVDDAANSHDGRSLKAERAGKKPTKSELKAFKEKGRRGRRRRGGRG
ncbi:unnamed protein product [Parascedosporium putredinis]|uniref:Uncharacterized protein n=1 Tax=Parascedosporium putredinis TaxID=1442378 RepID=A0A9P1H896_9PEZI|nr:unnamed protein product [Parascedosporium putredinis]CAI8000704.1 unnamed protein product [Parascedosporium putredinis]